jgi:hypothetical protein
LNDHAKLAIVMANYTSRLSFTNCLLHLEGEKVFGSFKQHADYPPGVDNDSHHPNHVNFSRPRVIVFATKPNNVDDVHM